MGGDAYRVGVDFGTSNTAAVLAFPDGRVRPLLFDGSPLLPSAVHADPEAGLLVGRDATHAARTRPDCFEPHPKRCVDDGTVLLGGESVTVGDLITAVLKRVAAEATRVAGGPVSEAVLTCPAAWGPRRQQVLRSAAAPVFGDVTLVAEPVAAATWFAAVAGRRVPAGSSLMVYDLGAGTFDASVVRHGPDGFEVLATRGLPDAGGLDVDAAIVEAFGDTYGARDGEVWKRLVEPREPADRRASRTLWDDVRAGKELLSRAAHTTVHVPLFEDEAPLGREQLDRLAEPVLERTVAASRAVLDDAGVAPEDLAGLFLVGGSSRLPLAAALLHQRLGVAPTVVEQPELVVAEGSLHVRTAVGGPPPVLPDPSRSWPPPAADLIGESGQRRSRRRLAAAALALAVVAGAAAAVAASQLSGSTSDGLSRVLEPLRRDCREATAMAGATRTLACRGEDGPEVVVGLFADQAAVDSAYQKAVREAGAAASEGDCAATNSGEHRYPATGPATGRVVCGSGADGGASLVWTDEKARTVSRTEADVDDAAALRAAWLSWTGAPAFPTTEERTLVDLLAANGCRRASVADLDDFTGATAGVRCDPRGTGATSVSYFRFGALAALQSTMDTHAAAVKAPTGVACQDGDAPGFLGSRRYDLRSVELGALMCHPGPRSTLVMQWSVESLLLAGRAAGTDAEGLSAWWRADSGPPVKRVVEAVNAQASPAFPTAEEQALLARVPERSRVDCLRPSPEQVRANVGVEPVVAVVCGPTSGASIVFYYQFPSQAAMRRSYGSVGSNDEDCTKLPRGFVGEAPWQRGGLSGRLSCATGENGNRRLVWTSDQLAIQAFAFQGGDPTAMIDWWRHDAGPV
ncbi:Hsp70 family protein [Micromonospora sp. CPCC 206061]|uniref:Hsp70 family protein n=1 Tax=Micromonospora sp. CPCC 206061 TaxID=3122410 RepID=UPI002FEFBCAD